MEPIPCPEPFDDEDYIYQVKWDGVRILAFINQNEVQLWNKREHIRTVQYPELKALSQKIKGQEAVLDGEVVVLKNGKPSFPSVMRRDFSNNTPTIKYMQELLPIDYMIFDILQYNGENLVNRPLKFRQQLLADIFVQEEHFHLVDNFPKGKSLFAAIKSQDLEGIVAKRQNSRYIPGKKHKEWLKIKYRRQHNCVVGGFTKRGNTINSLLLGVYQEDKFIYAGKAGSGLNNAGWEELSKQLPVMAIDFSPFANFAGKAAQGYHYISPKLVVQVEFAEWTEEMQLRSPVIKGFVDLKPEECVIE
jgi:bifunctional non-homologous end joining protein LigD